MVEPVAAAGDRQPGIGAAGAFAGFAPWIVYAVIAKPSTWEWAALAALAAALILAVPAVRGGAPRLLDVGAIGFFAAIAALGLLLDRADLAWLERYSQSLSSAVLALILFATLPFMPFTEQYARETVPREVWSSALFKHTQVVLTAVWGAIFTVTALVCGYAETIGTANDLLNWVIPVALVVGGFKFNQRYVERVRAGAVSGAEAPRPPGG